MRIFRLDATPKEEVQSRLFVGGRVTRQPLITSEVSKNFNFGNVNFDPGARNIFHTHTTDQILFVTDGEGIIATEGEEVIIKTSDIAFIPAGERHWHGATQESAFSHISLTAKGNETKF